MRFQRLLAAAAALAVGVAATSPGDAAIIYTLAGFSDVVNAPQSFSVTLPDYLTVDTTVPASSLTSCMTGDGSTCQGFEFSVNDPTGNNLVDKSLINFQTDSSGTFYYFDKADFLAPGVYDNANVGFNAATLTVTNTGAPGAPAPALGLGLLPALAGTGALGLSRTRRRRSGQSEAA